VALRDVVDLRRILVAVVELRVLHAVVGEEGPAVVAQIVRVSIAAVGERTRGRVAPAEDPREVDALHLAGRVDPGHRQQCRPYVMRGSAVVAGRAGAAALGVDDHERDPNQLRVKRDGDLAGPAALPEKDAVVADQQDHRVALEP
jgi:hypothetical protein